MRLATFRSLVLLITSQLAFSACLDYEDPFGLQDSGESEVGAPASIIGQTMVQTVTDNDAQIGTIAVGGTITYSFIDAHTILGEGMNTIATQSWSYTKDGNKGIVDLEYGQGQGRSKDHLEFTTETSGNYRSEIWLDADGSYHTHSGTFIIKPVENTPETQNPGSETCTSTEGKLTIYISENITESVSIYVDGNYAGSVQGDYASGGAPECGSATDVQRVTVTLPAGTHQISASSANYDWPANPATVEACGCGLWNLY